MGAYLSSPIVDKVSSDEKSDLIVQGDKGEKWSLGYGCSSMQGWRISQEDAHNAIIDFDTDTSFFAVYDGHGGPEVAKYCSLNLGDYLRSVTDYKEGNINKALEETFLQFDSTLTKPEVIADLKRFADIQSGSSADESEDDTRMLHEEAHMPIEEVLARYSSCPDVDIESEPPPEVDSASCSSSSGCSRPNVPRRIAPHVIRYHDQKPKSPMLHAKKSSEAGGSSSRDNSENLNQTEAVHSISKNENNLKNDVAVASSEVNNVDNEAKTSEAPLGNNVNGVSSSDKSSEVLSGSNTSTKENEIPEECCNSVDSSDYAKPAIKQLPAPSTSNSKTDTETGEDGVSSTTLNGESSKKSDEIDDSGQPSCSSTVSSSSARGLGKKKEINNPWISSNDTESSSGDESEDEDFEGADSDSSNEKIEEDDTTEDEDIEDEDDDNQAIDMSLSDHEKPGQDSGCTAVVALLRKNELYVANAGDSRCVLCREGKAVDMSFDHKPEDDIERQRIVAAGGKVTYDGRVNGGLNLSRAIGDHVYKSNSKLPLRDQMITALPDIQQITINVDKDEFMVLACDGIWNFMSSQEVIDFVKERLDKIEKLSQICEELFDHCLAPDTDGDGTGCDNMTAIIVKFRNKKSEENSKKRSAQEEPKKTEVENHTKKMKFAEESSLSKSRQD